MRWLLSLLSSTYRDMPPAAMVTSCGRNTPGTVTEAPLSFHIVMVSSDALKVMKLVRAIVIGVEAGFIIVKMRSHKTERHPVVCIFQTGGKSIRRKCNRLVRGRRASSLDSV